MLEGIECHVHTKQLLLIRTQPSLHMGWLTVALPAIPLPSGRQGREWGWVSVVCIGLPAVDSGQEEGGRREGILFKFLVLRGQSGLK